MRAARRDRLVGTILLVFAMVWTVAVRMTVPAGFGNGIGPRAFPFYLGLALIGLSVLLVASGWRRAASGAPDDGEDEGEDAAKPFARVDLRMAVSVFVVVMAYGFLMQEAGFLIATPLIIVATMVLVLGVRRPVPVAVMAIGITGGCWLIFGKLLGAYLPPGTWL